MLSTILVAVPALSRVDPAMTSGPTAGAMIRSTKFCSSVPGQHVTKMMRAPFLRAPVSAPRTNCVMPLAETPMIDVALGDAQPRDAARAFLEVVLDALARAEHRFLAAGHDGLHQLGRRAERRRHLGRFDDAEPAARAGADEEQPAALLERAGDDLDAVRDALALPVHGGDDAAVLAADEVDDVQRPASGRCRASRG